MNLPSPISKLCSQSSCSPVLDTSLFLYLPVLVLTFVLHDQPVIAQQQSIIRTLSHSYLTPTQIHPRFRIFFLSSVSPEYCRLLLSIDLSFSLKYFVSHFSIIESPLFYLWFSPAGFEEQRERKSVSKRRVQETSLLVRGAWGPF